MEDLTVRNERRRAGRDIPTKLDDLLYDAFYSAAIGGSVLGLFFLLVDVVAGQPFYTPSLMGSVLFLGMSPEAVTEVRLDLVAYVTMLHMGAFGVLGLGLSILVYEAELHSHHPTRAVAVLFLVIEGGVPDLGQRLHARCCRRDRIRSNLGGERSDCDGYGALHAQVAQPESLGPTASRKADQADLLVLCRRIAATDGTA